MSVNIHKRLLIHVCTILSSASAVEVLQGWNLFGTVLDLRDSKCEGWDPACLFSHSAAAFWLLSRRGWVGTCHQGEEKSRKWLHLDLSSEEFLKGEVKRGNCSSFYALGLPLFTAFVASSVWVFFLMASSSTVFSDCCNEYWYQRDQFWRERWLEKRWKN